MVTHYADPFVKAQYWVSILLAVYGAALLIGSRTISLFLLALCPSRGIPSFLPIIHSRNSLTALCGYLADLLPSRRLAFLLGLLMLAGSTVFLAVGNSLALLIVGRLLQGLSAAVVWVVGLALIVDTVGQKGVGQAMGWPGMGMSLAVLFGPLLGGVVFDKAGYQSVFAMCFGLLGVDIVLRLVMIERSRAEKWLVEEPSESVEGDTGDGFEMKKPDEESQATCAVKPINAAVYTSEDQEKLERLSSTIKPSTLCSPPTPRHSLLKRLTSTNLPPIFTLLRSRRLLTSLWGSLVLATVFSAIDSTLPLRVKAIFNWSSLGAGLIFLPIAIPAFFSPLFGFLSDRFGPRWFVAVGFLVACPALILLRLVDHDTLGQKILLCALLFLLGVGLCVPFAPIMAEISAVVERKERRAPPGAFGRNGAYAQAYALFNMAWAGGTLIGPIWGGLMQQDLGWGTEGWTLGLLCAFTAVVCAAMIGGWLLGEARKEDVGVVQSREEIQSRREDGAGGQ